MKTKLFIGFLFNDDQIPSRKIRNFRSRFDPKYKKNPTTHLGLVEPFECGNQSLKHLIEALKEEIDTFYFEQTLPPIMDFKGLDFIDTRKRSLLNLMPSFNQEIECLKELLVDICQESDPNIKIKNSSKFLTLGRFQSLDDLNKAISYAKLEFDQEQMQGNSIWLFKQTGTHWAPFECLFQFEEAASTLLQPVFAKI